MGTDSFQQYLALVARFDASAERAFREDLEALGQARSIREWNVRELSESLLAAGERTGWTLEPSIPVRLHNYVAAVYSMELAIRGVWHKHSKSMHVSSADFKQRERETFESSVGGVIRAVRDYSQHVRPPRGYTASWSHEDVQPSDPRRRLKIPTAALFAYLKDPRNKPYAAAALEWLEGRDSIDLWEVLNQFEDNLATHFAWFDMAFLEMCPLQFARLDAESCELQLAWLSMRLDSWDVERDGYPGHLLEGIVTRDDYGDLCRECTIRCDLARIIIDMLNREYPVAPKLAERIEDVINRYKAESGRAGLPAPTRCDDWRRCAGRRGRADLA